jgi:hypothetical protein
MARPARPERSRSARSSRQLSRFDHSINPDRVFGTHRRSAAEFTGDFKNVDVSNLPALVFYPAPAGLRIDTLINFRTGIIMLMAIEPIAASRSNQLQPWNTQRDY